MCSIAEKNMIDRIIDLGSQTAGELNYKVLHSKYALLCLSTDIIQTKQVTGFDFSNICLL